MRISVIGAGYVGIVSAACLSELGWQVTCIDNNLDRISELKAGRSPIFEPGLDELITRSIRADRLSFLTAIDAGIAKADIILLAVGTPMGDDGNADLGYIRLAVEQCVPFLDGHTLIVVKSTVPVGTNREIERQIKALRPNADFEVCSNPEFLREGTAIRDFMEPDRVLIGVASNSAEVIMRRLYQPLSLRDIPIVAVSRESAELAKYAANAFLALKITFINEMADLCDKVGADVAEVADAIGRDHRIGDKFLRPGPGYGGSCFPKDVAALTFQARAANVPATIMEQVRTVNTQRKLDMVGRIDMACGGLEGKVIAVLGVTFKPNTDDMRDAPSLVIVPRLIAGGAEVRAYDPIGQSNATSMLPGVVWPETIAATLQGADALVVLTEWNEFNAISLTEVKQIMRGNTIVDLRNIFHGADARDAGFDYKGVGRS